jgi:hypothetical protein
MSNVLIYGPSGTGKSNAARNLDPNDTFILGCDMQPLPFKGGKKKYQTIKNEDGSTNFAKSNYFATKDPHKVLKALQKIEAESSCSVVIIDTLTAIIVDYFMGRALEKGFERFNELGRYIYDILNYTQEMEKRVFVIGHTDKTDGEVKVRTIGKMLDEKVEIPSMFTIVLMPQVMRDEASSVSYLFNTQSDGINHAKSPDGMFADYQIPNDFEYIRQCMIAYEQDEPIPEVNA